jgi:hypothetical protein
VLEVQVLRDGAGVAGFPVTWSEAGHRVLAGVWRAVRLEQRGRVLQRPAAGDGVPVDVEGVVLLQVETDAAVQDGGVDRDGFGDRGDQVLPNDRRNQQLQGLRRR